MALSYVASGIALFDDCLAPFVGGGLADLSRRGRGREGKNIAYGVDLRGGHVKVLSVAERMCLIFTGFNGCAQVLCDRWAKVFPDCGAQA